MDTQNNIYFIINHLQKKMKDNLKIAWRNLWRNKRRTFITISSMFFAVFIAILMRSFQLGAYNHMINSMVTQYSGHLQIQDKEYADNQSIDYSIAYTDSIKNILDQNEHVKFYFPRIQTPVMASSGNTSTIAIIMGVNYQKENDLINLGNKIAQFYLDSNIINNISAQLDEKSIKILSKYENKAFSNRKNLSEDLFADGLDTSKYINLICENTKLPPINLSNENILIGYKLAEYLELSIGDSVILIGQGFRGASAIGKYQISGFLNFPTDAFNNRFIYMPLHTAQIYLSAFDNSSFDTTFYVNYIAINTDYQASIKHSDYQKILNVKQEIESTLNNKMLTVIGWKKLNKDMIQGIEMDNNSGKIMIFILYLIIAFGVLGTAMMMIAERKREFGVMLAIGMKRNKLSIIISLEMLIMGIISFFAGLVITAPIIWYGNKHPIQLHGEMAKSLSSYNMEPVLPFQYFDTYIFSQLLIVAGIVVMVLIYTLLKIRKLNVISSIRN